MKIDQRFSGFDVDPYIVAGPALTERPLFVADSKTSVTLTPGNLNEEIASQLAVNLGAQYRFIADPIRFYAAPDIGTGVLVWTPSVGANSFYWKTAVGHSPYIDPAYDFPCRRKASLGDAQRGGDGELALPAMVFDGYSWLQPLNSFQTGNAFTIGMVAVLHGSTRSASTTIMESFVEGVVTEGDHNFSLNLVGNRLTLTCGVRPVGAAAIKYWKQRGRNNGVEHFTDTISSMNGRPVIIMLSANANYANFAVVDGTPTFKAFRHPVLNAAATEFFIGRPVREGEDEHNAVMDVLELFTFNWALNLTQMHTIANRLDNIYRIST